MKRSKWRELQECFMKLPMLGLFIAFISASLFGLCNVIVKQVRDVDPFTIAFYRFIGIGLPASSIVIYRSEDPFPKGKRWLLVVRSILGASNLLIHFYGLKHMPMADANMISAASPIWVVIFARVFLKEPLKSFDIINVFVTLLGILFIIRPPFLFGYDPLFEFDNQYYIAGVIVFFGSVLFQSNVYILLRMLKGVHYSVTLSIFGLIGMLESAVFMFALGDGCIPACGEDRLMMVGVGLLSFLAQILLTVSLQLEEAGKVSIMRKAGDILFAFLFQILIFNELPGMWSIIGASLVSLTVLISSTKKIIDNLPEEHTIKHKYLACFYKKKTPDENSLKLQSLSEKCS
eukprot:TRINITY_DN21480_c0_g1_i2.p1 TRINITY_DN21480_c0_g1~~TRINITY_DN21480_c0_g1_i2.p1  ORF type:complete len:347 (-),score=48.63 TRINITY_DN21480_c0_g1_i2:38-1078(-)